MAGRLRIASLVAVVLLSACARVKVQKVHEDGLVGPTGNRQEPDGLHFYMPRPYVAVNEPFIINATSFLVGGQLTPDGAYVLINDVDGTPDVHLKFNLDKKIEASKVLVLEGDKGASGGGGAQGKKLGGTAGTGDADGSSNPDEKPPDTGEGDGTDKPDEKPTGEGDGTDKPEKPPGEGDGTAKTEEKHGVLNIKVTNDNTTFALTPMKRYFDIVYLPDFDQEYVVQGKAGLGNASIGLSLGQGWSLQGLDAAADNSAGVGMLLKLLDEASNALITLGKARLGLPGVLSGGSGAQGKTLTDNPAEFTGGTRLTIKVTIVKVVAPGLYPILKPKELACLKGTGCAAADNCCLAATEYVPDKTKNLLVPTPPLTNIAFNTYELLVVEAAKASGDSITGIGRYFDKPTGDGGVGGNNDVPNGNEQPPIETVLEGVKKLVNKDLQQPGSTYWEIETLEATDTGLKATAAKKGSGNPSMTKEKLVETVNQQLKQRKSALRLKVEDVTFK